MDKTVKLWSITQKPGDATAAPIPLLKPGETLAGPVTSVLFSPKGGVPGIPALKGLLLASTRGEPNEVRAWLFTDSPLVPILPLNVPSGHHNGVNCLAFHHEGTELSVGSPAATISTVRFKPDASGQPKTEIYFLAGGHWDSVNGLLYYTCRGEDRFVSASSDGTVKVWNRERGVTLHTFKGHLGPVNGLATNSDHTRLASASADRTVKVWDLTGNQDASILRFDDLPVQAVAFSPEKAAGRYLAIGSGWPNKLGSKPDPKKPDRGEVRVWDMLAQKELSLSGAKHDMGVASVAFGWDGQRLRLASASHDRTVKVWDAADGKLAYSLPAQPGPVWAVAFSMDGKRFVTGGQSQPVQVWDGASGKRLSALEDLAFPVYALAFHPDGKRLAVAGAHTRVTIADWETSKRLTISGHVGDVRSVAFSPDGRRLAWTGADAQIRVWKVDQAEPIVVMPAAHTMRVMGLAFSPNNLRLASVSLDRSVKIWDVETNQEILSLTPLGTSGMSVAFSPDGVRLVVADDYGSANVYDASPIEPGDAKPK